MISFLPHRSIIIISGEDRLKFIQGLITQDIFLLSAETPLIYGLLLSTKGRIEFDLFIYEHNDSLYIDTDRADDLINLLKKYKLRSHVDIEKTDIQVYASIDESQNIKHPLCFKDPRHVDMGYRIYSSSLIDCNTTIDEYDHHRLPLGIPDGQKDLNINKSLPLEWNMDQLSAISFTKGCYLGQELTARTKHTPIIRKRAIPCTTQSIKYKEAKAENNVISTYKNHAFIWHIFPISDQS